MRRRYKHHTDQPATATFEPYLRGTISDMIKVNINSKTSKVITGTIFKEGGKSLIHQSLSALDGAHIKDLNKHPQS